MNSALFGTVLDTARAIAPEKLISPQEQHRFTISDVGVGGVIRYQREVFVVISTATYQETNEAHTVVKDYVVHELVVRSLSTGAIRYFEWSLDDELEVSVTEEKLSSSGIRHRLKDDEGQEFSIDEDLDEAAEAAWPIRFDSKPYDFDDDWAFRYTSSDGRSQSGHLYEFGTVKQGWLTIEAWKDGNEWEYHVFLSSDISPSQIEIIALSS